MGILFAYLYVFARWLILPIFLIINLFNIIKRNKYLKMAGNNIVLQKDKKIPYKFIVVFIALFIIEIISSIFWIKNLDYIIIAVPILFSISIIISHNLYLNINGIYGNGIIMNEYITWNKIHSYKWIDNNTISFLRNNGNRIDFDEIKNRDKIIEIINEIKLNENNN
jgi:hypothetical protein